MCSARVECGKGGGRGWEGVVLGGGGARLLWAAPRPPKRAARATAQPAALARGPARAPPPHTHHHHPLSVSVSCVLFPCGQGGCVGRPRASSSSRVRHPTLTRTLLIPPSPDPRAGRPAPAGAGPGPRTNTPLWRSTGDGRRFSISTDQRCTRRVLVLVLGQTRGLRIDPSSAAFEISLQSSAYGLGGSCAECILVSVGGTVIR
jgi:hypothetical protein